MFDGGDSLSSGSFKVEEGSEELAIVNFTKTNGNVMVTISGYQDPLIEVTFIIFPDRCFLMWGITS